METGLEGFLCQEQDGGVAARRLACRAQLAIAVIIPVRAEGAGSWSHRATWDIARAARVGLEASGGSFIFGHLFIVCSTKNTKGQLQMVSLCQPAIPSLVP